MYLTSSLVPGHKQWKDIAETVCVVLPSWNCVSSLIFTSGSTLRYREVRIRDSHSIAERLQSVHRSSSVFWTCTPHTYGSTSRFQHCLSLFCCTAWTAYTGPSPQVGYPSTAYSSHVLCPLCKQGSMLLCFVPVKHPFSVYVTSVRTYVRSCGWSSLWLV